MCVFTSNKVSFFPRDCIYCTFEVEKKVLHKESLVSHTEKKRKKNSAKHIHSLTFLSQERKRKKDKMKEQNTKTVSEVEVLLLNYVNPLLPHVSWDNLFLTPFLLSGFTFLLIECLRI